MTLKTQSIIKISSYRIKTSNYAHKIDKKLLKLMKNIPKIAKLPKPTTTRKNKLNKSKFHKL